MDGDGLRVAGTGDFNDEAPLLVQANRVLSGVELSLERLEVKTLLRPKVAIVERGLEGSHAPQERVHDRLRKVAGSFAGHVQRLQAALNEIDDHGC